MKLRRLVAGFPQRRPGFEPRSGHVRSVVDKVPLGQVFFEYFGLPCQFSFHRLLHTHHLSTGAGTIGQLVADVPSGLSLTPPQETKRTNYVKLKLSSTGRTSWPKRIREVTGSKFCRDTEFPGWDFSLFSSVSPGNTDIIHRTVPRSLPSKPFQICHLLSILPSDDI
jgi:hypothetical protein